MKNFRFILGLIVAAAITSWLSVDVFAAPRAYVSAQTGSDANTCTQASPCRQFTRALNEVDAGGEVIALDSGDYASFTITKSVTVLAAPGVHASLRRGPLAISSNVITVNAPSPAFIVVRGLAIEGSGSTSGTKGISFTAGSSLSIENCVINGFPSDGISVTTDGLLSIKDTVVKNNTGIGVRIVGQSSSTMLKATIDHCQFENNSNGLAAYSHALVTISNSIITRNSNIGIVAGAVMNSNGTIEINVEKCVITNGNHGLVTVGNGSNASLIRLSNSTVTNNSGVGAICLTRGNNTIEGNGSNMPGPLPTFPPK